MVSEKTFFLLIDAYCTVISIVEMVTDVRSEKGCKVHVEQATAPFLCYCQLSSRLHLRIGVSDHLWWPNMACSSHTSRRQKWSHVYQIKIGTLRSRD